MDLIDNQSQEDKFEEETIYSKNIGYKDSLIMNDFHKYAWEENGFLLKNSQILD